MQPTLQAAAVRVSNAVRGGPRKELLNIVDYFDRPTGRAVTPFLLVSSSTTKEFERREPETFSSDRVPAFSRGCVSPPGALPGAARSLVLSQR